MGAQRALGRRDRGDLDVILAGLVDRVCRRLRAAHRMCRTVTLRLRFDDFTRATRGHTLPQPTAETDAVLSAARTLLTAAGDLVADRGLSPLGVAWATCTTTGRFSSPCRSTTSRRRRSTVRSTRSAAASARRPSPVACCWAATRA
jgi:DNA polymerase-4